MTNIDQMIDRGHNLCFGDGFRDTFEGRRLFEEAASLGRADALLYLGKSFELDGDYDAAEGAYLRGFQKKYRAAMFRLALLHKKSLIAGTDQCFYLRTIESLSREGHFPSIALYTNERMRGSYGFPKQVIGFLSFFPNTLRFTWNFMVDPRSHRFEQ